jgi:hypothetical protein
MVLKYLTISMYVLPSLSKWGARETGTSLIMVYLSWHKTKCHVMPNQCHINATSMPHQCHINATSMPRQCHVNATSMPHQCQINATLMPHQCHINATSMPHQCHVNATSMPYQCPSQFPYYGVGDDGRFLRKKRMEERQCHFINVGILSKLHFEPSFNFLFSE